MYIIFSGFMNKIWEKTFQLVKINLTAEKWKTMHKHLGLRHLWSKIFSWDLKRGDIKDKFKSSWKHFQISVQDEMMPGGQAVGPP